MCILYMKCKYLAPSMLPPYESSLVRSPMSVYEIPLLPNHSATYSQVTVVFTLFKFGAIFPASHWSTLAINN